MTNTQFFTQLGGVSLFTALSLVGLFQLPKLATYQAFGWLCLASFIGLSVLMFFIGQKAAMSDNKNNFTTIVLGFTMGKMFLSIAIIFAYLQLFEPVDKFFVAPFFAVYFIFTAFETYFMVKLGKRGV